MARNPNTQKALEKSFDKELKKAVDVLAKKLDGGGRK